MKIQGLFHKLLKSKYNSHFHYYCIIKSRSRNVSKKGYMACENQRCSNPLPRRGGSKRHPSSVQPAHAAKQRGAGSRGPAPRTAPERRRRGAGGRAARWVSRSEGAPGEAVSFQRGLRRWLSDSSAAELIALREAGIPNMTAVEINQRFVLNSVSKPPSFKIPKQFNLEGVTPLCEYSI